MKRKLSPKKCIVKKPLFNVYMRMRTDREFRKEYIAKNRVTISPKPRSYTKRKPKFEENRKCVSVMRKPIPQPK